MEKNTFARQMVSYMSVSEVGLKAKDAPSSTTAAIGATNWLRLPQSLVICHDSSGFHMGQIGELNGYMSETTATHSLRL